MKSVRVIKIAAINLVTFVVLLAIVNWACGVYLRNTSNRAGRESLPNYQADPGHAQRVFSDYRRVKHHYEAFVEWKCLPYQGETLTISEDGERTHIPPLRDASRSRKVHFFGGSTMWGEGSDGQHTIPALFNEQNPTYEVYNHGQLAYNSRQELDALLNLYSRNENPDLVIFYDGVNDAAFLCPSEIKELPAHRLVPMYREKLYVGKTAQAKSIASKIFLENILGVVSRSTDDEQRAEAYDCLANPRKAEQIADIVMTNWEMANDIVTRRGGKFIAVLQPAAFVGNPRTDHLSLDDELGKNFAAVYKHLQAKIREKNHPWIYDLSDRFDGDEYIFIDFCHVSPNGNKIIANELTTIVSQHDRLSQVVQNLER